MNKIIAIIFFLISILSVNISSAQNWTTGVPVYMQLTTQTFEGAFCFPSPDYSFWSSGSHVTGVDYYFHVDFASPLDSVVTAPPGDTLNTGDSILISSAGTGYFLFFPNFMGTLTISVWAVGTPVIPGESHPCQPNNIWFSNSAACPQGFAVDYDTACTVQPGAFGVYAVSTHTTCHDLCDGILTAGVVSGVNPINYQWSNGATTQTITNLCAGTYTVTVVDGGGNSGTSTAQVVSSSQQMTISHTTTNATCATCSNGSASLTVTGGIGSYAYSWSNGGTTSYITAGLPGVYIVTVTDSFSCSLIDTVTIGFNSSVSNLEMNNHVSIYPNPATEELTIEIVNGVTPHRVEIVNALGQSVQVSNIKNPTSNLQLNIHSLPQGIYFIKVYFNDGSMEVRRFVKE